MNLNDVFDPNKDKNKPKTWRCRTEKEAVHREPGVTVGMFAIS